MAPAAAVAGAFNFSIMLATSTLVRPQQVLIDCIIYPDANGNSVTPAYFKIDVAQFLLNRKVIAIESLAGADIIYSPNYPGVPVIGEGDAKLVTLVLLREGDDYDRGGDYYKNISIADMRRVWQNAANSSLGFARELYRIDPYCMAWTDSYMNIPTPLTGMNGPVSVPLLVTYLLPEQDETPFITVKHIALASR